MDDAVQSTGQIRAVENVVATAEMFDETRPVKKLLFKDVVQLANGTTGENRMGKSVKTILIALTVTLGACGSGSGDGNINRFVGVWAPTAGTFTFTCAGQSNTSQASGNVVWAPGSTSDLVQTIPDTQCVFHADVTGLTATGVPGQMCVVDTNTGGDSITDRLSFTAYTFSLGADGLTATESYSGNDAKTDNTTGASANCTFTQQASYAKQ